MATERIQLKNLPADFGEVLSREFVPYSVGLACISKTRPITFAALGSGTLIKKMGRIGILTADHCLSAVRAAKTRGDSIQMVLRNRRIELAPEITFEHTLARPGSSEYGPDLGFIEIAVC